MLEARDGCSYVWRSAKGLPPLRAAYALMASWRSGYAEDCKSLHPGSIPGEASISLNAPAASDRPASRLDHVSDLVPGGAAPCVFPVDPPQRGRGRAWPKPEFERLACTISRCRDARW